ncbi:MAG: hypothetical protein ABIZ34_00785, partial [Candidatus Limnocylindrales bacterium]
VEEAKAMIAVAAGKSSPGIRLITIDAGGTTVHHVSSQRDRQPSMAIGDNGTIHLAFWRRASGCDTKPCSVGIFYAKSVDGESWTVERVHGGERDVHPSISLDPVGKPWIYYRSKSRVMEAHKSQGEWWNIAVGFGCCGPDPLAGPEALVAGGPARSAAGVQPSGLSPFIRLAVYRDDFGGGSIVLSIFEADFIDGRTITHADDAFDPDLVIDAEGELHVAYRRQSAGLWHAAFNEQGNVVRTKIANAEIVGAPAIAAFPGGGVLVVAATATHLIFRTNATGPWTGGSIPMTDGGASAPGLATTPSGGARVGFLLVGELWQTRHGPVWP